MITNKDIRVENGSLILNGDHYPLDGQSPEAIMQIVEDNSDTTPTENSDAPITSGGVFSAIASLENIKVAYVSATMNVATADSTAIGGYRSTSSTSKALSSFTGYPSGKTLVAVSMFANGSNGAVLGVVRVDENGIVYLNTAASGDYNVTGYVLYKD